MARINLQLESYAEMTLDRLMAIGGVFDAFPEFRPARVGGDPARIKVDPSMTSLMTQKPLPMHWLTEVGNKRGYGVIELHPGRGAWMGHKEGSVWEYELVGQTIEQTWTISESSQDDNADSVAKFFEALVIALDPAWGRVRDMDDPTGSARNTISRRLPGIDWITYLGPAFIARYPGLGGTPAARSLSTGGVLLRTSVKTLPTRLELQARDEIAALFPEEAFVFSTWNPALPSVEDHLAASPGTSEMPWVGHAKQRDDKQRLRKFTSANKRLQTAFSKRGPIADRIDNFEWSTSVDADDLPALARHLSRTLGGDFSSAVGKALFAVITSAPDDAEDSVVLATNHGVVEFGWFMGDPSTYDLSLHGSDSAAAGFSSFFVDQ